jgi:hypothetical protein
LVHLHPPPHHRRSPLHGNSNRPIIKTLKMHRPNDNKNNHNGPLPKYSHVWR